MEIDLTDDLRKLRWELRLLAEERSLPKWQVVDILLDFHNPAISQYVLWKVLPAVNSTRVYLTWDDVDTAIEDLETP